MEVSHIDLSVHATYQFYQYFDFIERGNRQSIFIYKYNYMRGSWKLFCYTFRLLIMFRLNKNFDKLSLLEIDKTCTVAV